MLVAAAERLEGLRKADHSVFTAVPAIVVAVCARDAAVAARTEGGDGDAADAAGAGAAAGSGAFVLVLSAFSVTVVSAAAAVLLLAAAVLCFVSAAGPCTRGQSAALRAA